MKKMLFCLFIILSFSANATPPEPPVGKRWVLNEKFSDEFNGTKLDKSKWYDYHPSWKGRLPGLFMPSQVKVKDGLMSISGEKMKKDTIILNWRKEELIYNIKCGAVVSKTTDASYGYYECRFKASKTTLSTTFWMSSRQNYDGPETCNDRYGLELDFQECIGRTGDFSGSHFANGMNSNSHFWYTDCNGEKQDIRAKEVKQATEILASDDYHIYGGWWKDAENVSFYYDDGEEHPMKFNTSIKKNPFDQTMGLNMVCETYPFPWVSLPNDEELADPNRNTCYYDWVRSYKLVDVDDKLPGSTKTYNMFNDSVWFSEKPKSIAMNALVQFLVNYMARTDREIHIAIKNEKGLLLKDAVFTAKGGFGKKYLSMNMDGMLQHESNYLAKITIRPKGSTDNVNAYQSDEFLFVARRPATVTVVAKDERTNLPIKDEQVTFNGIEKRTNHEGITTFEGIDVGTYPLEIKADGYENDGRKEMRIMNDTVIPVFLKPLKYSVKVYVNDRILNTGIKLVKASINGITKKTDGVGKASFILPYGMHKIELSKTGYNSLIDTVFVGGSDDILVQLKRNYTSVRFIVKIDGKYGANTWVKVDEDSVLTSAIGVARFEEIEVLKEHPITIRSNKTATYHSSALLYNDTTITVNLFYTNAKELRIDKLKIYPNPARSTVFIYGTSKSTAYSLTNMTGAKVLEGVSKPEEGIDISSIKAGNYIISLNRVNTTERHLLNIIGK